MWCVSGVECHWPHVALSASSQQPHLKVSLFLGSGGPVRFRQRIPLGLLQFSTTSARVFLRWALKILMTELLSDKLRKLRNSCFRAVKSCCSFWVCSEMHLRLPLSVYRDERIKHCFVRFFLQVNNKRYILSHDDLIYVLKRYSMWHMQWVLRFSMPVFLPSLSPWIPM